MWKEKNCITTTIITPPHHHRPRTVIIINSTANIYTRTKIAKPSFFVSVSIWLVGRHLCELLWCVARSYQNGSWIIHQKVPIQHTTITTISQQFWLCYFYKKRILYCSQTLQMDERKAVKKSVTKARWNV